MRFFFKYISTIYKNHTKVVCNEKKILRFFFKYVFTIYKYYTKLIFLERKSTKLLKKVIEYGKKYLILYFTIGIRKIILDDSLLSLGNVLGVRYPPSLKY